LTCDIEEAKKRSASRAEKTNRYVPDYILEDTHREVSSILPSAISEGVFDKWALWDTNQRPPIKVADGSGKQGTLYNASAWKRFLLKAGKDNVLKYENLLNQGE